MAKIFSFASWNVKHFYGKLERVDRVVDLLKSRNPDLFALYEVKGKQVFSVLMAKMEDHSFFLTENTIQNDMEILVGIRRSIQCFVTQREEFMSKVPTLRPGALATLRISNKDYPVLYLHVKSFTKPRDWGLRDDMFARVARLKRKLDKAAGGEKRAPFICLGDLNTMGMSAPYNEKSDLSGDEELAFLEDRMAAAKMCRLTKTHEASWWNGKDTTDPSKLDQVFADKDLVFKKHDGSDIEVVGWPEETTKAKKKQWIKKYSDNAMVYGEVIGVL